MGLEINLNGLKLKNPILSASGTYGYATEYEYHYTNTKLGAIITKAITITTSIGNKGQRIIEAESGMINRIGLENMGVYEFIEKIVPLLNSKNINFIVNVAGSTQNDYIETVKILEKHNINAIELNLSCPNVKEGCLEFGVDETILYELVSQIRQNFSRNIIVKLTPNVTSIEKLAEATQKAGANCISAINTLKGIGMQLDFVNGNFVKKQVQGGYSGIGIKPIALSCVSRIRSSVDIPIIGMGGISSLKDIFEFINAGADAIQIGTSNFTHPKITDELVFELENFMKQNNFKDFDELKNRIRKA